MEVLFALGLVVLPVVLMIVLLVMVSPEKGALLLELARILWSKH